MIINSKPNVCFPIFWSTLIPKPLAVQHMIVMSACVDKIDILMTNIPILLIWVSLFPQLSSIFLYPLH